MKLLLLVFAIIPFLAQTTQGGWGGKKCWNNVGLCRSHCMSNENDHATCRNRKKCCVVKDKFPKDSTEAPAAGSGSSSGGSPSSAGALTPPPAATPAGEVPAGAPFPPTPSVATSGAAGDPAATPAAAAAAPATTEAAAAVATTTAAPTEAATTTAAPGGEQKGIRTKESSGTS